MRESCVCEKVVCERVVLERVCEITLLRVIPTTTFIRFNIGISSTTSIASAKCGGIFPSCAYVLAYLMAFYLAYLLAFYLAYLLAYYLA